MNEKLDVDINVLIALVGDSRDRHRMLLQKYAQSASDSIQKIKAACKDHDLEPIKLYSHRLKSSSSSIGAGELAGVFQSLEHASKDGRWNEINILVSCLDPLYGRVERFIETFCNGDH